MAWTVASPAGTDAANTIDTSIQANNTALDAWASAFTDGINAAGAVILKIYRSALATIFRLRADAADTQDRFALDLNGKMTWGSGAATPDVGLSRGAVDALRLDAGDYIRCQQDPVVGEDLARKAYVDAVSGAVATAKSGSGAGDYTTVSTSYVDVDTANLAYAVTVASGKKMHIVCHGAATSTAVSGLGIALTDGTTVLAEMTGLYANSSYFIPFGLTYIFTGDGASHTFKLRFKAASGTSKIQNSSTTAKPFLSFLLTA